MDQQVVKVKADREGACESMNHAQKYLTQANRHIAELYVQIARQRAIVKSALDTGHRSEMAESLLDALEQSLRIFERHRIFLLGCCSVNRPSKGSSKRPDPPSSDATGRELSQRGFRARGERSDTIPPHESAKARVA